MNKTTGRLDNIRIASPCTARWEQMVGNDTTRFCGECRLNVYNLSAMSRPEAEALIANAEGRICVRYHRRTDGTVITQDCPVGARTIRQRLLLRVQAVFAAFAAFFVGANANPGHAEQKKEPARTGGFRRVTMAPPLIALSDTWTRSTPPTVEHDTLLNEPLPLLPLDPPVTLSQREDVVMGGVDAGPVLCAIPVLPEDAVAPQATDSAVAALSDSTSPNSLEAVTPLILPDSSFKEQRPAENTAAPTIE